MNANYAPSAFERAVEYLPGHLRARLSALPERAKSQVEEFRLRRNQPLFVTYSWGEEAISGTFITEEDLQATLSIASGSSLHTVLEPLRRGFLPLPAGHRLAVCATAVMERGEVSTLRDISSLCLRLAKEYPAAEGLLPYLCDEGGCLLSTLLLSPPGGGKTTLLRDLVRRVSAGDGCRSRRVGLVDERGEIAGARGGAFTLNVGPRTDVMNLIPKAAGIEFLLRAANPQLLALDEITAEEDLRAMERAVGCGVTLLATAHAAGMEDLSRRKLYRTLLDENVFQRFVVIQNQNGARRYGVFDDGGKRLC